MWRVLYDPPTVLDIDLHDRFEQFTEATLMSKLTSAFWQRQKLGGPAGAGDPADLHLPAGHDHDQPKPNPYDDRWNYTPKEPPPDAPASSEEDRFINLRHGAVPMA